MELVLLGLIAMALFKEDPKKAKKVQRRRSEARRRARREREQYWEDAHWWHLNHGD